jgi:hypothetical protein
MENEIELWPEEFPSALFQPDPTLTTLYLEQVKTAHLEPEKRLMLAVLKDAVGCFQQYLSARRGWRRDAFIDAETWIEEESDWPFSFANICETLGMDPRHIREGLRRWKKAQLVPRRKCRRAASLLKVESPFARAARRFCFSSPPYIA